MSNGLERLNDMRTRPANNRKMPPPRNAPRATPVELEPPLGPPETTERATDNNAEARHTAVEPDVAPAAPQTPSTLPTVSDRSPANNVQQASQADEEEPNKLEKSTIYLDAVTDAFLEDVITSGRKQKPRIDSRSAIVRYALKVVAEQMTPDQVIEAIRQATPTSHGQGRPRL
ncbi:hypothetical protein ACN9MI_25775 (plasmid) [Rhodococcoides fascians]|jgi:hypothetical protein|uniref:hypothetical protein n=1 Tax=Rhodococcoides fascians TaxID=1828 RepID=UPI003CF3328C